jgi:hypothetical protein
MTLNPKVMTLKSIIVAAQGLAKVKVTKVTSSQKSAKPPNRHAGQPFPDPVSARVPVASRMQLPLGNRRILSDCHTPLILKYG